MTSNGSTLPRRRSMTDAFYLARHPPMADILTDDLRSSVEGMRQYSWRRDNFANSFRKLSERDLASLGEGDSKCPICLTSLRDILSEEETALAMESIAYPVEQLGVTRLVDTCGHVFCYKDIREWVLQGNTTCPTCRTPFMDGPPGTADLTPSGAAATSAILSDLIAEDEFSRALLSDFLSIGARNNTPGNGPPSDEGPNSTRTSTNTRRRQEGHEFSGLYS